MSQVVQFKVGITRLSQRICYMNSEKEILSEDGLVDLYLQYTDADYFDAYCVFEYLIQRELKKKCIEQSNLLRIYEINQNIILTVFWGEDRLEVEKRLNGIKTSIDMCKHGLRLVNVEFKDF